VLTVIGRVVALADIMGIGVDDPLPAARWAGHG
jgi:hypothetical protein